jgi:hypothetical protein
VTHDERVRPDSLAQRSHRRVAQLKAAIRECIAAHHSAPKTVCLDQDADGIVAGIARSPADIRPAGRANYYANHAVRTVVASELEPGQGPFSTSWLQTMADSVAE